MDAEKKCCNVLDYVKCKKIEIFGFIMVLLASIATLLSFSGLGLLGMLLVGWGLMTRRCCFKCRCCCNSPSTESSMCSTESVCDVEKPVKKTVSKAKKA